MSICPDYVRAWESRQRFVVSMARELTARQLTAQVRHAGAKELAKLSFEHGNRMDRMHLVALLHRCGALRLPRPDAEVPPWIQAALRRLSPPTSAREAASMLWALARSQLPARVPSAARLAAHSREALPQLLPEANAQELSNVAWALATLTQPQPSEAPLPPKAATLWARLGQCCAARAEEMTSQHLANVSWAHGTLRLASQVWFAAVSQRILAGGAPVHRWEPRHVANLLWGLARVGLKSEELLAKLEEELCESGGVLSTFAGRDVAAILWAYASLEAARPRLVAAACAEAAKPGRLRGFSAQDLQNLAWALAIFRRAGRTRRQRCNSKPPAT
ncbi:RAP [Symbiodinium natans]|uniref:RAP protein n=1 Tax=Symbiodinium natans TaxID=878477 RepID=A0A812TKG3_9DINO|nr:RAP [Symbiodinium natans]